MNAPGERSGIAEGEKHATRRIGQRPVEHVGHAGECPGDEADTEYLPLDLLELSIQLRLRAERTGIAAADNPQPAGVGHRRRQPAAGDQGHGRAHDWVA